MSNLAIGLELLKALSPADPVRPKPAPFVWPPPMTAQPGAARDVLVSPRAEDAESAVPADPAGPVPLPPAPPLPAESERKEPSWPPEVASTGPRSPLLRSVLKGSESKDHGLLPEPPPGRPHLPPVLRATLAGNSLRAVPSLVEAWSQAVAGGMQAVAAYEKGKATSEASDSGWLPPASLSTPASANILPALKPPGPIRDTSAIEASIAASQASVSLVACTSVPVPPEAACPLAVEASPRACNSSLPPLLQVLLAGTAQQPRREPAIVKRPAEKRLDDRRNRRR
ncbi:MAG: hypothetical protein FJX46_05130 [Alphaproteobacteria bacterium]|nr:hypothetical protein [Alphaproteobacteria bacterium]